MGDGSSGGCGEVVVVGGVGVVVVGNHGGGQRPADRGESVGEGRGGMDDGSAEVLNRNGGGRRGIVQKERGKRKGEAGYDGDEVWWRL